MLLPSLLQLLLRQAPATSGCCSDEFNESIQQMPTTVMTTKTMMTRPKMLRSAICQLSNGTSILLLHVV
ncbi:hypothetical protein QQG55_24670 [Brugia pahangi]|uniref:Secreted protein n=1 Tax=Brugia pahangi TaxID=6280 RepID=A0A0N4T1V0_BRUPA|nr:unnamed protein product [Brugia pahangi]